jgi:biotin operon repressor
MLFLKMQTRTPLCDYFKVTLPTPSAQQRIADRLGCSRTTVRRLLA